MELWTGFFLLYTIMHPISDFIVRNKLGKRWHYLTTLNPLHWIWDKMFSFHHKWLESIPRPYKVTIKTHFRDSYVKSYYNNEPRTLSIIEDEKFWVRLGIDQTVHVLLNLLWAFISVHLLALYFPGSPLLMP